MEGAAILERPRSDVPQTPKPSTLPQSAGEGKLYSARHGKSREYASFADSFQKVLTEKLQRDANPETGLHYTETVHEAEAVYEKTSTTLSPQIQEIIKEMKRLGIINDLVADDSFSLLLYGIKTDQWGERQRKDYPQKLQKYVPDPDNPLNTIRVDNGEVQITKLNNELNTTRLRDLLQTHYNTLQALKKEMPTEDVLREPLREWVQQQAVTRDILLAKKDLQQEPLTLEGAEMIKRLEKDKDVKQMSNPVEIWQTPDGRQLIVKRSPEGAEHTLRAEILENRIMQLMGIPVPPTELAEITEEKEGIKEKKTVLVVGFLDAYKEEDDPFALSEKYHSSRVLQNGLIVDLWLNQYNRRPHNVMMKDGKIAFIDHGAALFSRATGGFKGFSSEITPENMWDLLRTIPDDNPNGDVPVNESYTQILTVTDGPNGVIYINDPLFLRTEVARLSRVSDEQIQNVITEAGYTNDISELEQWEQSDAIQKRLEKLQSIPENKRTQKDNRDLRWTLGAVKTIHDAKEAGGMKNYLTQTLIARRKNLVAFLHEKIEEKLKSSTTDRVTAEPPETTTRLSPRKQKIMRWHRSLNLFSDMNRSQQHNATANDFQKAA